MNTEFTDELRTLIGKRFPNLLTDPKQMASCTDAMIDALAGMLASITLQNGEAEAANFATLIRSKIDEQRKLIVRTVSEKKSS